MSMSGNDNVFAKPYFIRSPSPRRPPLGQITTSQGSIGHMSQQSEMSASTSSHSSSASEDSHTTELSRQTSQTSLESLSNAGHSSSAAEDSGYSSSKETDKSPKKFIRSLRKRSKSRTKDENRSRAATPEPVVKSGSPQKERGRQRTTSFKKINIGFKSRSKDRGKKSMEAEVPPMPELVLPIAERFMRSTTSLDEGGIATPNAELSKEPWNQNILPPVTIDELNNANRHALTAPNSPIAVSRPSFESSLSSPGLPTRSSLEAERDSRTTDFDPINAAENFPYGPPPIPGDEPQPKSFLSMSSSTVNLLEQKKAKKAAARRFVIPAIKRSNSNSDTTASESNSSESTAGKAMLGEGGSARLAAFASALGRSASIGLVSNQPLSTIAEKGAINPHFSFVEVDGQEVALTPMSWIEVSDPNSPAASSAPNTPTSSSRSDVPSFVATDSIYGAIVYANSLPNWSRGKQSPFPKGPLPPTNSAPRVRVYAPNGSTARYRDMRVIGHTPIGDDDDDDNDDDASIYEEAIAFTIEPPEGESPGGRIPSFDFPDDVSSKYPQSIRLTNYSTHTGVDDQEFMDEGNSRYAREQFEKAVKKMMHDDGKLRVRFAV